jgi:hypothetical protein
MSTPAWILEIFAAATLLVAEVSAGQLVLTRAWTQRNIADADIAVSRLVTGIAMAGILVSGLRFLPNGAWEAVFAVMTAWLAWRLWRESRGHGTAGAGAAGRSRYAPPLVHSAAMLYLFAALAAPAAPGTGGMAGMGLTSSGLPTLQAPALALIFTLLLIAFAVHDLDRRAGVDGYFEAAGRPLVPAGSPLAAAAGRAPGAGPGTESAPPPGTAARLLLSPAVVKGCQVATGVTMAFILIILI